MTPLDNATRQLAEVTARVIVKAEKINLPDSPDKLVTSHAIRFLARAHLELLDQIRALHDLVDQTKLSDPIGTALTKVGLTRRPPDRRVVANGPRLVLTPSQIADLSTEQLVVVYHHAVGDAIDFTKHETYVVRLWDGMDGCWIDCAANLNAREALLVWALRTNGGAHHVSYDEIDYYAIFRSDTRMLWDGSEGMEMHR